MVNFLLSFFQDVSENLDPSLNPILSKNTIQRGNQAIILIGETEIEYNSNFRLYMTTPLANPHFLPEVCIKVTVINFTVTLDGLQDQLLSRVVQKERPKLEESRKELLQGLVTDRYKLRELEDRSLSLLHSSRGMLKQCLGQIHGRSPCESIRFCGSCFTFRGRELIEATTGNTSSLAGYPLPPGTH